MPKQNHSPSEKTSNHPCSASGLCNITIWASKCLNSQLSALSIQLCHLWHTKFLLYACAGTTLHLQLSRKDVPWSWHLQYPKVSSATEVSLSQFCAMTPWGLYVGTMDSYPAIQFLASALLHDSFNLKFFMPSELIPCG